MRNGVAVKRLSVRCMVTGKDINSSGRAGGRTVPDAKVLRSRFL